MGIFARRVKAASHATPASRTPPIGPDLGQSLPGVRADGPFDRAEVSALAGRIDLGALWVTAAPGVAMHLEMASDPPVPVALTAVMGKSSVQLQAFAAPTREGVWADVAAEIAAGIAAGGGTATVTTGPWGTELRARVAGQGRGSAPVPTRFVGIDGPRWFLRAVITGPAALGAHANALLDVVRATVVVRGPDAMAPRELLPLRLPGLRDQDLAEPPTSPPGPAPHGDPTSAPVDGPVRGPRR